MLNLFKKKEVISYYEGELSYKEIEKATVYLDCWMTAEKIQELKSKRAFFAE